MALSAPAVRILGSRGASTGANLLAARAALPARVIFVPVYWAGLPFLRTAIWRIGFAASACLHMAALV